MTIKKTTLSLQLILCANIIGGSMHALSDQTVLACYQGVVDSSFKYLEFLFIEKPKNRLTAQSQALQTFLLAFVPGCLLAKSLHAEPSKEFFLATGALSLVGYNIVTSYVDSQIKLDILTDFIKNWEFHRPYVPTQLTGIFDELAAAYATSNHKTIPAHLVAEFFEVIQHLLEHEFPKRYEKDKVKSTDTLNVVKTVIDISKNLR